MPNALISVYRKEGIAEFARELQELGFTIYSTGGTCAVLREAGLSAIDIADRIGKSMLGHRVASISREISAALLARNTPEDDKELWEKTRWHRIDLLCVDMYPLQQTIDDPAATPEQVLEQTDIGGPLLLRAAAKGRRIVIATSEQRAETLAWLRAGKPDEEKFLRRAAARAEYEVAKYCLASARHLSDGDFDGMIGEKVRDLKYGENAWQSPAALFKRPERHELAPDGFKVEAGDLSYNNFCDLDRLVQTAAHVARGLKAHALGPYALAIAAKHGNPCGASIAGTDLSAIRNAIRGDDRAVYGGWLLTDALVGAGLARSIRELGTRSGQKLMLAGVLATGFSEEAKEVFKTKTGEKWKLVSCPALAKVGCCPPVPWRYRFVPGGFLRQPDYGYTLDLNDPGIRIYGKPLNVMTRLDLMLAWAVGSTSNSNTVTLVNGGMLLGNGVGQQDRLGAAGLAITRADDAGHLVEGAVAYSDSFFPFVDGPMALVNAGIRAILATSGSVRDKEVIAAVEREGVTLVLLPDAKARGFFGH